MSAFQSRNRRDGITSRFRLRGFDYSLPGFYFITVCIENRAHLFGKVANDVFTPSKAGGMVRDAWLEQGSRFPGIELDAFCVMPNHFHALVGISTQDNRSSTPVTLSQIMQGFKSATTVEYCRGVKALGWPGYDVRLWQTGYHDHIVRDDRDLERIRDYIGSNPENWQTDEFFPIR
jgi:REP element-mobilizing transposase RayT